MFTHSLSPFTAGYQPGQSRLGQARPNQWVKLNVNVNLIMGIRAYKKQSFSQGIYAFT